MTRAICIVAFLMALALPSVAFASGVEVLVTSAEDRTALIMDEDGNKRIVRPGDLMPDGSKVTGIQPKGIVVEKTVAGKTLVTVIPIKWAHKETVKVDKRPRAVEAMPSVTGK